MDRISQRLMFVACLSLFCTSAFAAPEVTRLTLVSETRVSRTIFEYRYRVTVRNPGTSMIDVTAKLVIAPAGTQIVNGNLFVGDLFSNASATPAATITLRQDRTIAFDSKRLVWNFTGSEVPYPKLPPDPGPGGNSTLGGVDTDADGVRDDVQRYIAAHLPAGVHQGAFAVARALQGALLASDAASTQAAGNAVVKSVVCLAKGVPDDVQRRRFRVDVTAHMLNTELRSRAYAQFNGAVGPTAFTLPSPDNACA